MTFQNTTWPSYENWLNWKPVQELQEVGRLFHGRGWSVGTSSNYSAVISTSPARLLITVSGKDKGRLGPQDFLIVDDHGVSLDPASQRPSAETMLHCVLATHRPVGCVLHTHSVWGTIISELGFRQGCYEFAGYEMLKGLEGVKSHDHTERVAIFENTQDISALSKELAVRLKQDDDSLAHAFLIHGHGLYTWGKDVFEARRHVEILEFLFELACRKSQLGFARPGHVER